jgi:Ca2+-binding RTX toxin-like protein
VIRCGFGQDRVEAAGAGDLVVCDPAAEKPGGLDPNRIDVNGPEGTDDVIAGGAGVDRLEGGFGADLIDGDASTDRLFGGAGDDRIRGGTGNDRIRGGAGDDHVFGGVGSDQLLGDAGNDILRGGSGNDGIHARDGVRDRISCGPGRDRVIADRKDRISPGCETVRLPGRRRG